MMCTKIKMCVLATPTLPFLNDKQNVTLTEKYHYCAALNFTATRIKLSISIIGCV